MNRCWNSAILITAILVGFYELHVRPLLLGHGIIGRSRGSVNNGRCQKVPELQACESEFGIHLHDGLAHLRGIHCLHRDCSPSAIWPSICSVLYPTEAHLLASCIRFPRCLRSTRSRRRLHCYVRLLHIHRLASQPVRLRGPSWSFRPWIRRHPVFHGSQSAVCLYHQPPTTYRR